MTGVGNVGGGGAWQAMSTQLHALENANQGKGDKHVRGTAGGTQLYVHGDKTHGIGSRHGTDVARTEMEVNYFGMLRLAQEFGPVMRARSADGATSAVAWVNVLSVFALCNFPAHGTFSASKAAAHSLSQCLRAEMRAGGAFAHSALALDEITRLQGDKSTSPP